VTTTVDQSGSASIVAVFGRGSPPTAIEYNGQTFVAADDYLDSVTFYIGNLAVPGTQTLTYRLLVTTVTIDGNNVQPGAVLFESSTITSTLSPGPNHNPLTVDTSHLALQKGQTYAFIIDAQAPSGSGSATLGLSYWGEPGATDPGTNYAGGVFFAYNASSSAQTRAQAFAADWAEYNHTDAGQNIYPADLRFKLAFESNQAPTDIALSSSAVAENSANNTVIGDFTATDPDAGESFTFALIDSASGRFAVSGNHLVVADGARLDYEQATSHQVQVSVTDSKGHAFLKFFTVQLSDVVEFTKITGTRKSEKIDAKHSPSGEAKPSGDDDLIEAKSGDDTVQSLGGNDTIYGGKGEDVLNGGKGKDAFVFDTKLGSSNVDTIVGFKPGADRIWLDKDVFAKLKGDPGDTIGDKAFHADKSGKAHDKNDRIVYETDTGKLFYDDNGNRSGHAVLIAHLDKGLHLSQADFLIV
jgi:Ca2+-binding RTX toxin-like protein